MIFTSPILVFSILIAIGNNMFDGLIESSGAALIDQSMNLPLNIMGLLIFLRGSGVDVELFMVI